MNRLHTATCTIALFLTLTCTGQMSPIDSLHRVLSVSEGEDRIDLLIALGEQVISRNIDSAMHYAQVALDESRQRQYLWGLGKAHQLVGRLQEDRTQLDSALWSYHESLKYFEGIGDLVESGNSSYLAGIIYTLKSEYAQAEAHLTKSLSLFEEGDDLAGQRKNYDVLAMLAKYQGDYQKAIEMDQKSLEIAIALDNDFYRAIALYNMGIAMMDLEKYKEALPKLYEGLKLNRDYNLALAASLQNAIGRAHLEQDQDSLAMSYFKRALGTFDVLSAPFRKAPVLDNLGEAFLRASQYDSALHYLHRALDIYQTLETPVEIAMLQREIGSVHLASGDAVQALDYFLAAAEQQKEFENKFDLLYTYNDIGAAYIELRDYVRAETFLQKAAALKGQGEFGFELRHTYKALADVYERVANYQKALYYHREFVRENDAYLGENRTKEIAEITAEFETEIKDKELVAQQQQIGLLERQQQIDQLWRAALIVGVVVVLLLAMGIYLYFLRRTKRKQQMLEAEQRLTHRLDELNETKSRFFANISHEFRTPLSLIIEPANRLMERWNDVEDRFLLGTIQRNSSRLLKLVNQLLELSKVEAGEAKLKTQLSDFGAFVKGIVHEFDARAAHEKKQLTFTGPAEEVAGYFDSDKVELIVTNLLSNAFKFTHEGDIITVRLLPEEQDAKEGFAVEISDTGIGMSSAQLPHVFDRFFQGDNSDTRNYEGTGIGLSLVKEFVELHRGAISVDSKRGSGASFRFWLPAGRAHLTTSEVMPIMTDRAVAGSDTLDAEMQPLDHPGLPGGDQPREELLIVEDSEDLRHFMSRVLEEFYIVHTAADGREGYTKALDLVPDLIVSDVMMPEMDGITLCKKLKEHHKTSHIPLVLLTAKVSQEDKLRGLESLADDYLMKPFSTQELIVRIQNLISTRRLLQEKFRERLLVGPEKVEAASLDEVFLGSVKGYIEEHFSDEFLSVEQLSQHMNMSRVHLHRKVQALTNLAPSQLIRQFRLVRAMDLLRQDAATVAEIAYQVGFSSPAYFSKCFSDAFGIRPKDVARDPTHLSI
ncbi:MAG: tetratricopeptide repeat protein [Bacteroidota bacterium]